MRQNCSDPYLLRSNIPEYSFVGFAGATSSANTVALTVGLVTGLPYPESRPIRVLMSREECRSLAIALERLAHVTEAMAPDVSVAAQTGAGAIATGNLLVVPRSARPRCVANRS